MSNKIINKKTITLLVAVMMIVSGALGGTIAWLISVPEPVVNTFTYGDINIDLDETETGLDEDGKDTTNEYKMLPGQDITKDPIVTVRAGSEEMWLFVKLEKSANFNEFLTYVVDGEWTLMENSDNVYYRHVTAAEVEQTNKEFHVLADDKVTVKETVTKDMLNDLDKVGETPVYPTLTVSAYAVQYAGSATPAEAWAKVEADRNF